MQRILEAFEIVFLAQATDSLAGKGVDGLGFKPTYLDPATGTEEIAADMLIFQTRERERER
jgi:hypothetical protein